jgi:hypothetical protein
MRELIALALLAGNAVFLFVGVCRLFFVLTGWVELFGQRCEANFPTFVGLVSLVLPMAALILATHIKPMVPRTRAIVLAVAIEYGASAVFGLVTFLGAFAHDLDSPGDTIEGLLERGVWIAFLVLACVLVARVQMGLFPRPAARPYAQPQSYLPTTYGQPYPGQPLYPQTYPPARTSPATGSTPTVATAGSPAGSLAGGSPAGGSPAAGSPVTGDPNAATQRSGWPAVPPPPMPALPTVDADPTTRIALPVPPTTDLDGDATQIVKAPEESRSSEERGASPAAFDRSLAETPEPPAE